MPRNICIIVGCGQVVCAEDFCQKHYRRWRLYGHPNGGIKNPGTLVERFWRQVDKGSDPDGCWLWSGTKNPKGYGAILEGGKKSRFIRVHRLSFQLHHGPIPEGKVVMHSCDIPACVNPAHLSVGTHKDNTHDMMRKGRLNPGISVGSQNGNSALTPESVRYIRANPQTSHAALARELGVAINTVFSVRKGRTWGHLK